MFRNIYYMTMGGVVDYAENVSVFYKLTSTEKWKLYIIQKIVVNAMNDLSDFEEILIYHLILL